MKGGGKDAAISAVYLSVLLDIANSWKLAQGGIGQFSSALCVSAAHLMFARARAADVSVSEGWQPLLKLLNDKNTLSVLDGHIRTAVQKPLLVNFAICSLFAASNSFALRFEQGRRVGLLSAALLLSIAPRDVSHATIVCVSRKLAMQAVREMSSDVKEEKTKYAALFNPMLKTRNSFASSPDSGNLT